MSEIEAEQVIVVRQAKRPARTYVYGIRFGRYVKIGTSAEPGDRMRALPGRILKPNDLDLQDVQPLFAVTGDISTERTLHLIFADHRAIGEWFVLPPAIVDQLLAANTDSERAARFALTENVMVSRGALVGTMAEVDVDF